MDMIYYGIFLIFMSLVVMTYGLTTEINKRMINITGYSISVGTLNFGDTFTDENGNKIKPIRFIALTEIKK